MTRYVALIDGNAGAYGVSVPDLPGCVAMGKDIDDAIVNAVDAVRDWIAVAEDKGWMVPKPRSAEALRREPDVRDALVDGALVTTVPIVRSTGRPAKANISVDVGTLMALDHEAARRKLTRSALIELLTREALPKLG